ncbi:hypothetical protein D920_00875 [Enterococcus faecalis 13-SD-W-01]|nr:hypothetical protein D920_00875 [Enterococcus faecalis 13-SD-W-01]
MSNKLSFQKTSRKTKKFLRKRTFFIGKRILYFTSSCVLVK